MMSQVSVCKIDMIHTQSVHMSLPSLCETSLKCYLPLLSWGEGFNVSVLVKQVLPWTTQHQPWAFPANISWRYIHKDLCFVFTSTHAIQYTQRITILSYYLMLWWDISHTLPVTVSESMRNSEVYFWHCVQMQTSYKYHPHGSISIILFFPRSFSRAEIWMSPICFWVVGERCKGGFIRPTPIIV